MANFKKWSISLLMLGLAMGLKAQQQQEFGYTQYMANLTPFNQAYSMLDKNGSVSALVRRQFLGIQGGPSTFILNGNLPIESMDASAGFLVMNDQFAIEHNTQIGAYFAKSIQVGESQFLAVSLSAGLKYYTANLSSLDANDPEFRNDVRQTVPNLGFGVMYYTDRYYLGLSMPELTITGLGTAAIQQNTNFRNHYYFSGAYLLDLDQDIKFKPATLLAYANGVPFTANVSGTIYLKDVIGVGVNYRSDNAISGLVSVNVEAFKLGYSYQFSTASRNLGGLNNAIHEITLAYRFGKITGAKLL